MNIFLFDIAAPKRRPHGPGITSRTKSLCLATSLAVIICSVAWATGAEPLSSGAPTTVPSDLAAPGGLAAAGDPPKTIEPPLAIDPASPLAGPATQASLPQTSVSTGPSDAEDLRQLIGVHNPNLVAPVELPKLPAMSLLGFLKIDDHTTFALLEVVDLNRVFIVKEGTEIPITVQGRISPINQSELVGLGQSAGPAPKPDEANAQSQIILKIIGVSDEGVIVQAGLNNQTIVIK